MSHNRVYHFAKAMMWHTHDAEDVTQEVYTALYKYIGNIRKPDSLYSWLDTTTYRVCLNQKRKFKPLAGYEKDLAKLLDIVEGYQSFIPEEAFELYEFRQCLWEIVNDLPNKQKECIKKFYYQHLSVKEIAKLEAANENTIKSRLRNGKATLRAVLADIGSGRGGMMEKMRNFIDSADPDEWEPLMPPPRITSRIWTKIARRHRTGL